MTVVFPRWLVDGALPFATAIVILFALVFGGGTQQGFWSDAIVQLASLPLLAVALFNLNWALAPRGALVLLFLLVTLPLVQTIPLPPVTWAALPGREEIEQAYSSASLALPWLPLSLQPSVTWRSLFSLIPAVAVFLAVLSLPNWWRRVLIQLLLAVAFVSVLLDLLQIIGGQSSPLRFYEITNADRAVGFFANSNHNAAFLYSAVPFAVAFAIGLIRRHTPGRVISLMSLAFLIAAIIMGLALTRSRAGLALGFLAGLSCGALALFYGGAEWRRRVLAIVIGGNMFGLLIAFQFGFVGMAQRIQNEERQEDLRWPLFTISWQAAEANLPFGSGFGTFISVYERFEPRTMLAPKYINRAHNDWLEVFLEGGVLALTVLFGFVAWFVSSNIQLWRHPPPDAEVLDSAFARSSSIVVGLLLVHSTVDYPLRTTAMMVVFALCCALMSTLKQRVSLRAVPKSA